MSDEIGLFHLWIDAHREEMVEALRGVLRIPSKEEPPAGPDAPYGKPVREALDYTLDLCRKMGFRVKDVGGHAGHAEFGQGDEMVAAIGHLDVVPEGDRWTHDPYGAEIENGYIYARGSSDDKGPTYAALFGARAVMESGLPLRRRIRVIFGCNEESGFGCVKNYWDVQQEERPVLGFTPDGSFPMIYAEKGIANLTLTYLPGPSNGDLRIVSMQGGLRPNMVPDRARAHLAGPAEALVAAAAKLQTFWDRNVSFRVGEGGITVDATGKSAHGSRPEIGDNAVARLCRALAELELEGDKAWLEWVALSEDPTGAALGIAGRDDVAGPLTCNLGVFSYEEGVVRVVYNIRYPVTWKVDDILARAKPAVDSAGWALASHSDSPPLYVPVDEEPAKTLLRVYQLETGDHETKPQTTGGGTYARATPNILAYGMGFPDADDGPAHEPDEKVSIERLVKAAKIYAHALYELAR